MNPATTDVPSTTATQHRMRDRIVALLALIMVIGTVVNGALFRSHPPASGSIHYPQYQSLMLSVASAIHFSDTGVFLIVDLEGEPLQRHEDLAADDVGYTIGLSLAARAGLVEFSPETRAATSRPWTLEESRALMSGAITDEMHHLNRIAFAAAILGLALALLTTVRRSSRVNLRTWRERVGLASAIWIAGQLIPHLWPRLVVWRLHVHGLIASLAVLGLLSVLVMRKGMRGALVGKRDKSLWALGGYGLLAGTILGAAIGIRRAEGLIWLVLALAVAAAILVLGWKQGIDRRSVIGVVLIGAALFVGLSLTDITTDRVIDARENAYPELPDVRQEPKHPTFHVFLIGISRSDKNILDIHSEEDVVRYVQEKKGIEGDAFSVEYQPLSGEVYWDYVTAHPLNYAAVLIDNVPSSIDYVLNMLAFPESLSLRLALVLGLTLVLLLAWRRGGLFRFLGVVLFAYGLLGFGLTVATTSPAAYGPATAIVMVGALGLGLLFTKALQRVDSLAATRINTGPAEQNATG